MAARAAPRPSQGRGALYMLASAFAFSVMTVFVKQVGQRLPSQEIVFARAVISLALSYVLIRNKGIPMWGERKGLLLLRGVCGFCGLSCVYYSVTHLPLAEATVIQYLHPTFTAVLAALILREHVGKGLLVTGCMSLLGVALVARSSFLFSALGIQEASLDARAPLDPFVVAVAIGGAFFSASAYVVVRRLSRTEDPLVIVMYFPLVTLPATLPALWGAAVWPVAWEWGALLGIGLAAQAGQVFLTWGLQLLPAARGTALSYSQVVFAASWGILFFDEIPTPWTVFGAALIITGTFLVARSGSAQTGAATKTPTKPSATKV